jgi:predicted nucleotide-binding protein
MPKDAPPNGGAPTNDGPIGPRRRVSEMQAKLQPYKSGWLGVNAVILHEQPNGGRTIIEKFEQESAGTSFAVVLLTDDDSGAANNEEFRPRARQNVVFEMGYFVGVLGRERVAALVAPGVELPSDYSGVVYIQLHGGSWKLELAKEMKHAGVPVDLNRAI